MSVSTLQNLRSALQHSKEDKKIGGLKMVNKYAHVLEERQINDRTGEIWKITDVPKTWRAKTQDKIEADGYVVLEDGTVDKAPAKGDKR